MNLAVDSGAVAIGVAVGAAGFKVGFGAGFEAAIGVAGFGGGALEYKSPAFKNRSYAKESLA